MNDRSDIKNALKGIWKWTYGPSPSTWHPLIYSLTANKIMSADLSGNGMLEIIIDIPGSGLLVYDLVNHSWKVIGANTIDFTVAMTGQDHYNQIIASYENGLFILDYFSLEWNKISAYPGKILYSFDLIRENGIEELITSFDIVDGLYCYNFETGNFIRLIPANATHIISGDFTGNGKKDLVCSFETYGTYLISPFDDRDGQYPKDKAKHWITDSRGWHIYRIGYFGPDEGHYMASGNITSGPADELFFVYNGRTYLYSFVEGLFSLFSNAPFKRIISSRFTGQYTDDLIVCDSITGSIYLYNSGQDRFELLEANGNSNAMVPLK